MTLRGVLFDMGGTLLHYNAPNTTWEDTEKTGARAVYFHLRDAGYSLPPESETLNTAWDQVMSFWSQLTNNHYDPNNLKLDHFIRSLVASWQVGEQPETVVEALGVVYMRAIQAIVYPLDGAADTLRALRDRGLRIGLISNTLWPGSFHLEDLQRHGLIDYIDHKIFSSDANAWKPFRDVFQLGLDALQLPAEDVIFVGDALYLDIWGAQQAGLRGVWIEQERFWTPEGITVTPDASVKRLPELLSIVDRWQS